MRIPQLSESTVFSSFTPTLSTFSSLFTISPNFTSPDYHQIVSTARLLMRKVSNTNPHSQSLIFSVFFRRYVTVRNSTGT